ncbi:hypothetical protein RI367_001379 [Sorochytrium milnesiophthora]
MPTQCRKPLPCACIRCSQRRSNSSQHTGLSGVQVVHAHGEFTFLRAYHDAYGEVIVKCCTKDASAEALALLRWEFYVTRSFAQLPNIIAPLELLENGFAVWSLAVVYSKFPLPHAEPEPALQRSCSCSFPHTTEHTVTHHRRTRSLPSSFDSVCGSLQSLHSTTLPDNILNEPISVTLSSLLHHRGTINLEQALSLLRKTVVILRSLHQSGVIYRNFSFDTVVLRFDAGDRLSSDWHNVAVSLRDFSYTTRLTSEQVSPVTAEFSSCGDLRFMSPESTGRMNRAVDCRSDFYSVGMLIHGALTGSTPPLGTPVLKLLQYHVCGVPTKLSDFFERNGTYRDSPQSMRKANNLNSLLERLVAKLPEDRYLSCSDILQDVDRLSLDLLALRPFSPTLVARPQDVLSDSKLYGRDEEIQRMMQFQQQVLAADIGGVALVTGTSGVGKTYLVQEELICPTFCLGGIYCFGKFEQYATNEPYSALSKACTDAARLLFLEDRMTVGNVVSRLKTALGDNLSLLATVVPNLEELLGVNIPPPSVASPTEALTRTQQSLMTFFQIVASFKPLTIFIDDVQWADTSSGRFIKELMQSGVPPRVLLVMAARKEEIHLNPQLADLLPMLRMQAARHSLLLLDHPLEDMQPQHIAVMIDAMFRHATMDKTAISDISGLVALTHEKTMGNPLYVRRFFQNLFDTGLLKQDEEQEQWTWDLKQIRRMLPTENVIEMLASELEGLPAEQRAVLKIAALVGNTFKLFTLAQLLNTTELAIWDLLLAATTQGYIRVIDGMHPSTEGMRKVEQKPIGFSAFVEAAKQGSGRKLTALDGAALIQWEGKQILARAVGPDGRLHLRATSYTRKSDSVSPGRSTNICYQWSHDRIQQAAYQLIKISDRPYAHLTIACRHLSLFGGNVFEGLVFDTVHHLHMAKAVITDARDRQNVSKLHLLAAASSKSRSAFEACLHHCKNAVEALEESVWMSNYELAFSAHHALAEAGYNNAEYDQMKEQIDLIQRQQLPQAHIVLTFELDIRYLISQGRTRDAVSCGQKALLALGYNLSTDKEVVDGLTRDTTIPVDEIARLIDMPLISDPGSLSAARILIALVSPIYFVDPPLLVPTILTVVKISREKGNSEFGAYGYCLHGLLLAAFFDNIPAAHEFGKLSLQVLERVPPNALQCPTYKVFASHIKPWVEPIQNTYPYFEAAIAAGRTWMNAEYLGYAIVELFYKLFAGGPLKGLLKEITSYAVTIRQIKQPIVTAYFAILPAIANHLCRKHTASNAEFLDLAMQTNILQGDVIMNKLIYWFGRVMLHVYSNEIAEAYACTLEADKVVNGHVGTLIHSEYLFFKALALIRMIMSTSDKSLWEPYMAKLAPIVEKIAYWNKHCPSTFGCRLALLNGCMAWLQRDALAGMDHIDQAVSLARQHGFLNIQALANELAGHWWVWSNRENLASSYYAEAQSCYDEWNAEWKAQSLSPQPELFTSARTPNKEELDCGVSTLSDRTRDEVGMDAIFNWTVALASERTHDGLLEQFLRLCVLNSSATDGYLLWSKDDTRGATDLSAMTLKVSAWVEERSSLHTRVGPENVTIDKAAANAALSAQEPVSNRSPLAASASPRSPSAGGGYKERGWYIYYPVLRNGVCIGLLHLTNRSSPRTLFGETRVTVLKLLSSQVSILSENMRLVKELSVYNEALRTQTIGLEETVSLRTRELEASNKKLTLQVAEREKAEAEAVQAAHANRSFLHTMSHELRTPLNCIIGMTELLSQMELSAEHLDLLRPIQSSAKDLLQIINNVLDLSKIESGKLTCIKQRCCLRDIVDNALESVSAQAMQKGIALAAMFPSVVPSKMLHDGIGIGQILRNLLSNAVKFTAKGDVYITVSAQAVPDASDSYSFTIACTDSGIGIPAEHMGSLFKPFSQLDNALSRQFEGTGLGLSISKKLASILGGDLTCTSVVGKGSTFKLAFEAKVEAEKFQSIAKGLTAVVCHPKALIRQMLCGYLTCPGHQVKTISRDDLAQFKVDPNNSSPMVLILDHKHVTPESVSSIALPKIFVSDSEVLTSVDAYPLTWALRFPVRRSQLVNAIQEALSKAPKPAPARPATLPRPQTQFGHLRVLLAEDNLMNRQIADRMLRKYGIMAAMAENGRQAVDSCRQQTWDLVLMDVMMPVMDGLQATRVIREIVPSDRQPKIIALTANAFAEDKAACLKAGMEDFLSKPLTLQMLHITLMKHFPPT